MKSIKKFSVLQISRLLIQIVFFIFLPSIYIGALNGVKEIYQAIIHQNFSAAVFPQLIEVIAVIPVTILFGRFFCGWMCAFGSFSDFIYLIARKVWRKKLKINEQADRWMKSIKYIVLAVLVIAVWSFDLTLFAAASPWDVFGMLVTVGKMPDFPYVLTNLTVGFVIFIAILFASTMVERFFCRYLCPMGAIFAIASKLRITKIKKPSAQCGNCRACTNNCAMGIPLYKMDSVRSGECINCMKCVTVCPRGNTDFSIVQNDVRPLLAGTATVAAITGMYFTGNLTLNASGLSSSVTAAGQNSTENKLYKDGTYEGSGTGFRGGTTTVSVTVKNDKITNISTVSTRDDDRFYNNAYSSVSQEILSSQSADVDAVSGATFSSNGIMEAVANALEKAKISGLSSVESSVSSQMESGSDEQEEISSDLPSQSTPAGETSSEPSSSAQSSSPSPSSAAVAGSYKDGTYQGSGTGFRGTTSVNVVVSGGKITEVNVNSYEDDRKFFERAYSGVSQNIINSQSANVDAVSGATFSSNGIMAAVADALSQAAK